MYAHLYERTHVSYPSPMSIYEGLRLNRQISRLTIDTKPIDVEIDEVTLSKLMSTGTTSITERTKLLNP
jgi:hypothetical protein